MRNLIPISLSLLFSFPLLAQKKTPADLLLYNAKIYTVDARFSVQQAMAIKAGKIVALGTAKDLEKKWAPHVRINAEGKTVVPGLIDAHAHFVGYAMGLQQVNLTDTKTWDEVLQRLQFFQKAKNITAGQWIIGRGWDQNDWPVKDFPSNTALDSLFPNNPVLLTRVDGHAAIASSSALQKAGVQPGQTLTGGSIEAKDGKLTGILIDNAVDLVSDKVPSPSLPVMKAALQEGAQNLFAQGLTTIHDCGLDFMTVEVIKSMQASNELQLRLYVMLSDNKKNFDYLIKRGPIKTPTLNVRSFKVYADGALGSRGAALLQPYHDRPDWSGFLLSSLAHFDSVAALIKQHGFQMNTHAIGDSGNRAILDIYAKYLGGKNDQRWRIEHAQVVSPQDFQKFGTYSIIPSVQPTHATSDMYWAADRLGPQRVKGAYAFKQLQAQNGWLPLGTDFPVEDISPFKTFYAAVVRKDSAGFPTAGFQTENALSRKEALQGMTIWAARAGFEEGEKGSLEVGKWADFVILDRDLMMAPQDQLLGTKVLATYLGGQRVYSRNPLQK